MERGAVISECGKYRYRLWRTWDSEKRPAGFICLNPSTADAEVDDPTILSCCRIAKRQGAGGIVVVNLYAYRATDPKDLKRAGYPVGPENDAHIRQAVEQCHPVIAAWGANGTAERVWLVKKLLKAIGVKIHCLGFTNKLQPRHPLYIETERMLLAYEL